MENKLECLRDYVAFSSCNSYIFTCYRDFDLSYLLESTTLKKWEIKSINVDTSLSYNDCVPKFFPRPLMLLIAVVTLEKRNVTNCRRVRSFWLQINIVQSLLHGKVESA